MCSLASIDQQSIFECCSSTEFASTLAAKGPFSSIESLIDASRITWWQETPITGWLEAFAAHPQIGDMDSLRKKFGAFAEFSKGEQAESAATASEETLQDLAHWNYCYKSKFGHIFIICAAGKSAQFMLDALQSRYTNDPSTEISIAAAEQQKITELRLYSLLKRENSSTTSADRRAGQILQQIQGRFGSPITTHVLDTCLGRPAPHVNIKLHKLIQGSKNTWECLAIKQTNQDGRVPDLLEPSNTIEPGVYRITFDTAEYMQRCSALHPSFFADQPFYPIVDVHFTIAPTQTQQHFHVPLTWNPYGYSTYRGS